MPSFDVVSEVDHHELHNGVDQANREVSTRFDFKGTGSNFELAGLVITMNSESEFQLQQMYDILCNKLVKRGIDIACLQKDEPVVHARSATQTVNVKEGIETSLAKDMIKLIKQSKAKVQAAIQGDQLRITGKKRDDLQEVISLLKGADLTTPLQYKNFRD
ncbi:MAG TPA: YajQ family cyclic di-GMP-binding protein [Xanthomonadales bacterium]